jgi:hypothetical protein
MMASKIGKEKMKRNRHIVCLYLLLISFSFSLNGQYIPVHLSHHGIYDFLDEMASQQVIELNSAIKPYSRSLITEKLLDAEQNLAQLSNRQLKELQFYLKDYGTFETVSAWAWINNPAGQRLHLFNYRDTNFHITVNPILGGDFWSNKKEDFSHWWNGVETYASYGGFALFASLRDNHESTALTNRGYMNQRIGASNIKTFAGGNRDYWEVRGGMTYAWKWGHVGLLMDQFSWGDAQNGSNIFSGRTPAFARIDLQLNPVDWLQFNYVHGWLISEVPDSTLSFWINNPYGTNYRNVYHPKFLAANLFTFKPFNHFYIGVGNSVIHDHRSPHAAFFIPVMFWKALDHTLNAGIDNMNSQIFFTLSSRNIKGLHIYSSLFIDEVQVGRIFREGEYNFTSLKLGTTAHPYPNTTITVEYTWSNGLVFRHYVPTTTFESNRYNLGHFLEDNARDLYIAAEYRPYRTLKIRGYYNFSEKGPDHTILGTMPRTTIIPLNPVVWESSRYGISVSMQVIHDLCLRLGYEWRNVTGEEGYINLWTPDVYYGKTGTLNIGLNYGF